MCCTAPLWPVLTDEGTNGNMAERGQIVSGRISDIGHGLPMFNYTLTILTTVVSEIYVCFLAK